MEAQLLSFSQFQFVSAAKVRLFGRASCDLEGHPTANRAYAWSYERPDGKRRFLGQRAREHEFGVHQHPGTTVRRLQPEECGGVGAAAVLGIGPLRLDLRRVIDRIEFMKLHDTGERKCGRTERHR